MEPDVHPHQFPANAEPARASDLADALDSGDKLSTPQIVERIMALNPTASPGFLINFRREALADYLDHLVVARKPRGRDARWVRRGTAKGISVWEPRD